MPDTAQTQTKWVYSFGGGGADGDASLRNLLGGKGANLAEMATLGLPVPPGFTLTTDVCNAYYEQGETYPDGLTEQVDEALKALEAKSGKTFGDPDNPLLVSVRSGARASMPGMMDTVLNLGLSEVTVKGLAERAGARFAYDSYRRFIQMYSNVVMGMPHDSFEYILDDYKNAKAMTSIRTWRLTIGRALLASTKPRSKMSLASPFQMMRMNSFGVPLAPCSAAG